VKYPVLFVNASENSVDEAEIVADQTADAFVFAALRNGELINGRVVGYLGEKEALTLRLVTELGEADARRVRDRSGETTGPTVWNNRLSSLSEKGILVERNEGRTKLYRPVIGEIVYGQ
jgi:hypothetical protein